MIGVGRQRQGMRPEDRRGQAGAPPRLMQQVALQCGDHATGLPFLHHGTGKRGRPRWQVAQPFPRRVAQGGGQRQRADLQTRAERLGHAIDVQAEVRRQGRQRRQMGRRHRIDAVFDDPCARAAAKVDDGPPPRRAHRRGRRIVQGRGQVDRPARRCRGRLERGGERLRHHALAIDLDAPHTAALPPRQGQGAGIREPLGQQHPRGPQASSMANDSAWRAPLVNTRCEASTGRPTVSSQRASARRCSRWPPGGA